MINHPKAQILMLAAGALLLARPALAQSSVGLGIVGKFYVSSVTGTAECVTQGRLIDSKEGGLVGNEGRITVLKKGTVVVANGSVISTGKNSNVTLVFSNQTAMYLDENTELEIKRFDQEPFQPNNNLLIEPSNSATLAVVKIGRVIVDTPRLLSGTTMAFETRHSNITILNVVPSGQKAFIEVTERQTHVAMIAGEANVTPIGAHVVTRLTAGRQAFVKYTVATKINGEAISDTAAGTAAQPGAAGARATPATAAPAVAETRHVKAEVLRVSGSPMVQLPGGVDQPLAKGAMLPEGSVIVTSQESEAYIRPFNGAVADIKPGSRVQIVSLELGTARDGSVVKQTSLLDLQAGVVVSVIDPAKRAIDDYAIDTPRGVVRAHGTSFAVSVNSSDVSILATADTVIFTSPSGTTYEVNQGNVVVIPAGGQPQSPVPLAGAVAANPGLAALLQTAVATMIDVVQGNIGGLPAGSADALLSQVVGIASAAMPDQASTFAAEATDAINAAAEGGGNQGADSTTYIVVSQLDNSQFNQIEQDLESTNAAGSSVSFTQTTDSDGNQTVNALPNTPVSPTTNNIVSPANQ
jgi:hypothetical protein